MRRFLFFIPLIISLIIGLFSIWSLLSGRDPASIPSALVNNKVPEFQLGPIPGINLMGLSNEDISKSQKITVLNFFASWCIPCSAEHSSLKKLAWKEDIFLVGVNYKDTAKDASEWLNKLGNPYARTGFDSSGRIGIEWGISGVPETFIIDKNGIILNRFSGPLLDVQFEEFEKTLMGHLNES